MEGIEIYKEDQKSILFVISDLSDDLQSVIRQYLCEICYGKEEAKEVKKKGDYQKTLKVFWERYEKKSSNQKMGMIAELLAHVLLILFFPEFKAISVFFNKEEKSMRKGFDLIYLNKENKSIWYGEVKSGNLKDGQCPDVDARIILSFLFTLFLMISRFIFS